MKCGRLHFRSLSIIYGDGYQVFDCSLASQPLDFPVSCLPPPCLPLPCISFCCPPFSSSLPSLCQPLFLCRHPPYSHFSASPLSRSLPSFLTSFFAAFPFPLSCLLSFLP